MVEYRPLTAEHDVSFAEYTSYGFHPETGPVRAKQDERTDQDSGLGDRRGLFADDAPAGADPLCVCRHYWTNAQIRGAYHSAPGLSAVASPPEYRRQGYIRRLLVASLREYRERGDRFSILYGFRTVFYSQYGWATGNRVLINECAPTCVSAGADDDHSGSFRQVAPDEFDALTQAYDVHARRYALSLRRETAWWLHRVFADSDVDPYVYAYEADGSVRGYLIYTIEGDRGDRVMDISELVAVDIEAYRALLAFCYRHESQVQLLRLREPTDSPLHDVVDTPDEITSELRHGAMVRIVDVEETLSALAYPAVNDTITFDVDDPLVDWNTGTFRLEITDGTATCEPTTATPDVELDVGSLSQLAVGSRSADRLSKIGQLTPRESDVIDRLNRLFPKTPTFLSDVF